MWFRQCLIGQLEINHVEKLVRTRQVMLVLILIATVTTRNLVQGIDVTALQAIKETLIFPLAVKVGTTLY